MEGSCEADGIEVVGVSEMLHLSVLHPSQGHFLLCDPVVSPEARRRLPWTDYRSSCL